MRKKQWKTYIMAALCSAWLLGGGPEAGNGIVLAAEAAETVDLQQVGRTGTTSEKRYVLGRPMTEQEKAEQLSIIQEHRTDRNESLKAAGGETAETIRYPETGTMQQQAADAGTEAATDQEELPIAYSSREKGYTPEIRDQGGFGICWAYAGVACAEISMVKNGILPADEVDLSEFHAVYYTRRPVEDPLGGTEGEYRSIANVDISEMYISAGKVNHTSGPFTSWMGPVQEEDFFDYEYLVTHHNTHADMAGIQTAEHAYGDRAATITEVIEISRDNTAMKKAIMEYGALAVHYFSSEDFFNPETAAQYCNINASTDHAVAIVGWDDTFSRTNFLKQPSGDGAWLVRNSWGNDHGDGGYFWLSYEDSSLTGGMAYKAVSPDKYDHNYQYDRAEVGGSYVNGAQNGTIEAVNVFTIQGEETLEAVFLGIQWSNTKFRIQIYKNPEDPGNPESGEPLLDTPIEGIREIIGRYTVDLGKPLPLEAGDRIAVSVTYSLDNPMGTPAAPVESSANNEAGRSLYRVNGGQWKDQYTEGGGNFMIKAFTKDMDSAQEEHIHDWSQEWSGNDTYHWHECQGSGCCTSEEGMAYGTHQGGTAGCGIRKVCDTCGKSYGLTDTAVHTGGKERRGRSEATTVSRGYTGDLYCMGCNMMLEEGEVIPMLTTNSSNPKSVPNPGYEFTSVEEAMVSSRAGESPKLLFFYDASGEDSLNTLRRLAEHPMDGVEICAVEVQGASRNRVLQIQESLGEGHTGITFCYDTGTEANAARIAYEKALTGADHLPLPVLCYVDDKDQLRHISYEKQEIDQIRGNLSGYCGMKFAGMDQKNPSQSGFTGLKGETLSLQAENRPKVLLFVDASGPSQRTVTNLATERLAGADVYLFDVISQGERDTQLRISGWVKSNDSIKVSADTNAILEMFEYLNAAGISINGNTELYPVICYLDKENKLQKVTSGESNLRAIKSELLSTCGYDPHAEEETGSPEDSYTVTVNSGEGSGSYRKGETVTISAPELEGKLFQRWRGVGSLVFIAGNVSEPEAGFVMPARNVELTAVYESLSEEGEADPAELTGIRITTQPERTSYHAGEAFDHTGMIVTAVYSDGTSRAVTGYSWTPQGALETSDRSITISYAEQGVSVTAEVAIQVTEPEPAATYAVTVTGGSGSGSYEAGAVVTIRAEEPEAGQQFVKWQGTEGLTFISGSATSSEAVFKMPERAVSLVAVYEAVEEPEPEPEPKPWIFDDVDRDGGWKHKAVDFVYQAGMMNAINGTRSFQPDRPLERAMLTTILHRWQDTPAPSITNPFRDLEQGSYYYDAVIWAAEQGIVSGMGGSDRFVPKGEITREQIAKMLYEYGTRVLGLKLEAGGDLSDFTDAEAVSDWAVTYMQWATGNGIITGKPNDDAKTSFRMAPGENATRAECAAMLQRFAKAYVK